MCVTVDRSTIDLLPSSLTGCHLLTFLSFIFSPCPTVTTLILASIISLGGCGGLLTGQPSSAWASLPASLNGSFQKPSSVSSLGLTDRVALKSAVSSSGGQQPKPRWQQSPASLEGSDGESLPAPSSPWYLQTVLRTPRLAAASLGSRPPSSADCLPPLCPLLTETPVVMDQMPARL